uniref:Transposase Tnp1/En/Spm-like domain-containing protein n=1 Tax=Setaria italica TaxID=4555 RepID=K3YY24_SETIT
MGTSARGTRMSKAKMIISLIDLGEQVKCTDTLPRWPTRGHHSDDNLEESSANAQPPKTTVQDQKQVYLMSLRHENKPVAKGNLVTTDSTHVVGGNMLGYEYVAVAVHIVSDIGDEDLPRPYDNICTVRDVIGYVIAWPRSHVKRPRGSTPKRP